MNGDKVVDWTSLSSDELTEEAVRARHRPAEHFRVSRYRYESKEHFEGSQKAGVWYVIQGALTLTNRDGSFQLHQRQVLFLSSGNYEIKVTSNSAAEVVHVWELPPSLWPENQP